MRFNQKRLIFPFLVAFLFVTVVPSAFALDGVWHNPYGLEDRYIVEPTERFPQKPVEGEDVYIKITTWPIEPGQAVWVTWQKNGIHQPNITADYKYNSGNNTYWEAALGSFAKGDTVNYTVHANRNGTNEKTVGPFDFTVTAWESVSSISGFTDYGNRLVFDAVPDSGSFQPKLGLSFDNEEVFRIQLSPTGSGTLASGSGSYTLSDHSTHYSITTSKLSIRIEKNPFKMEIYKADGTTLIARQYDSTINRNMAWLTDGNSIINKVQDHYYSPASEQFYGFGERYDTLGKRGQDIETYIYNQYLNQNERTYLAVPYFINTNGYGVLLNSTYYSQFKLATERSDMHGFTADTGGGTDSLLDYYFFAGDNLKEVTANYTTATAKPELLPKWAFGFQPMSGTGSLKWMTW